MTDLKHITVEMGLPIKTVVDFICANETNYNRVEEELQIQAIEFHAGCLEYMARPSKRVQEAAIRLNPVNIGRIRRPSREIQLLAVSLDARAIDWLIKPCAEAKSLAAILA